MAFLGANYCISFQCSAERPLSRGVATNIYRRGILYVPELPTNDSQIPTNDDQVPTNDNQIPTSDNRKASIYRQAMELPTVLAEVEGVTHPHPVLGNALVSFCRCPTYFEVLVCCL